MITIQMLEENDIILESDYCRPLQISYSSPQSDHICFTGWGGNPINNMKWVKVSTVLGSCWFGKKIKDFHKGNHNNLREFVRGDIPQEHILKNEK